MNPALETRIGEFEQQYLTQPVPGKLPDEVGRATLTVLLYESGYEKIRDNVVARFRDGQTQDVFIHRNILEGNGDGYSYVRTTGPENMFNFMDRYERSFYPDFRKEQYTVLGAMIGLVAGVLLDIPFANELQRHGNEWMALLPPLGWGATAGVFGYFNGKKTAKKEHGEFAEEFRSKWGAVTGNEAIRRALRSWG